VPEREWSVSWLRDPPTRVSQQRFCAFLVYPTSWGRAVASTVPAADCRGQPAWGKAHATPGRVLRPRRAAGRADEATAAAPRPLGGQRSNDDYRPTLCHRLGQQRTGGSVPRARCRALRVLLRQTGQDTGPARRVRRCGWAQPYHPAGHRRDACRVGLTAVLPVTDPQPGAFPLRRATPSGGSGVTPSASSSPRLLPRRRPRADPASSNANTPSGTSNDPVTTIGLNPTVHPTRPW